MLGYQSTLAGAGGGGGGGMRMPNGNGNAPLSYGGGGGGNSINSGMMQLGRTASPLVGNGSLGLMGMPVQNSLMQSALMQGNTATSAAIMGQAPPPSAIWDNDNEQPSHAQYILFYQTEECPIFRETKFCGLWGSKLCIHYHADYQRRRCPVGPNRRLRYYPEMCPMMQNHGTCPRGDDCIWAHTKPEVYFHPAEYKTQECSHFASNKKCTMPTAACSFAHGDQDLRVGMQRYRRVQEVQTGRLDFVTFKTRPCTKTPCKATGCVDYHDEKDRRRADMTSYVAELCEFVSSSNSNQNNDDVFDGPASRRCTRGDRCPYAHNKFEELYHPDRYKLSFCRNRAGGCTLGPALCAFAHDPSELRRELIDVSAYKARNELVDMYLQRYKTEPCPYKNETHHYPHCIYYHNPVDFRRPPWTGYGKELCPSRQTIDKCPRGLRCPFSHGHIEQMYHPAVYKTSWCDHRGTDRCRGKHCAFAHTATERREAPKESMDYTIMLSMTIAFWHGAPYFFQLSQPVPADAVFPPSGAVVSFHPPAPELVLGASDNGGNTDLVAPASARPLANAGNAHGGGMEVGSGIMLGVTASRSGTSSPTSGQGQRPIGTTSTASYWAGPINGGSNGGGGALRSSLGMTMSLSGQGSSSSATGTSTPSSNGSIASSSLWSVASIGAASAIPRTSAPAIDDVRLRQQSSASVLHTAAPFDLPAWSSDAFQQPLVARASAPEHLAVHDLADGNGNLSWDWYARSNGAAAAAAPPPPASTPSLSSMGTSLMLGSSLPQQVIRQYHDDYDASVTAAEEDDLVATAASWSLLNLENNQPIKGTSTASPLRRYAAAAAAATAAATMQPAAAATTLAATNGHAVATLPVEVSDATTAGQWAAPLPPARTATPTPVPTPVPALSPAPTASPPTTILGKPEPKLADSTQWIQAIVATVDDVEVAVQSLLSATAWTRAVLVATAAVSIASVQEMVAAIAEGAHEGSIVVVQEHTAWNQAAPTPADDVLVVVCGGGVRSAPDALTMRSDAWRRSARGARSTLLVTVELASDPAMRAGPHDPASLPKSLGMPLAASNDLPLLRHVFALFAGAATPAAAGPIRPVDLACVVRALRDRPVISDPRFPAGGLIPARRVVVSVAWMRPPLEAATATRRRSSKAGPLPNVEWASPTPGLWYQPDRCLVPSGLEASCTRWPAYDGCLDFVHAFRTAGALMASPPPLSTECVAVSMHAIADGYQHARVLSQWEALSCAGGLVSRALVRCLRTAVAPHDANDAGPSAMWAATEPVWTTLYAFAAAAAPPKVLPASTVRHASLPLLLLGVGDRQNNNDDNGDSGGAGVVVPRTPCPVCRTAVGPNEPCALLARPRTVASARGATEARCRHTYHVGCIERVAHLHPDVACPCESLWAAADGAVPTPEQRHIAVALLRATGALHAAGRHHGQLSSDTVWFLRRSPLEDSDGETDRDSQEGAAGSGNANRVAPLPVVRLGPPVAAAVADTDGEVAKAAAPAAEPAASATTRGTLRWSPSPLDRVTPPSLVTLRGALIGRAGSNGASAAVPEHEDSAAGPGAVAGQLQLQAADVGALGLLLQGLLQGPPALCGSAAASLACLDAEHLIAAMTRPDLVRRPSCAQALQHPFFWSSSLRVRVLVLVAHLPLVARSLDPTTASAMQEQLLSIREVLAQPSFARIHLPQPPAATAHLPGKLVELLGQHTGPWTPLALMDVLGNWWTMSGESTEALALLEQERVIDEWLLRVAPGLVLHAACTLRAYPATVSLLRAYLPFASDVWAVSGVRFFAVNGFDDGDRDNDSAIAAF